MSACNGVEVIGLETGVESPLADEKARGVRQIERRFNIGSLTFFAVRAAMDKATVRKLPRRYISHTRLVKVISLTWINTLEAKSHFDCSYE